MRGTAKAKPPRADVEAVGDKAGSTSVVSTPTRRSSGRPSEEEKWRRVPPLRWPPTMSEVDGGVLSTPAVLQERFDALSDDERDIIECHLFADSPLTLEELGKLRGAHPRADPPDRGARP